MRFLLVPAIIALVINVLIDIYIYCALHSYFRSPIWRRLQAWSAVAFNAALIVAICLPKRIGHEDVLAAVMWILYAYLSIYIPKAFWVICDICSRIPFLWKSHRWKWLSVAGFWASVIICLGMWWGALINKYQIQVKEEQVTIARLPKAFEGLTIAQISDLHVGTFGTDTKFVTKLVNEVNSLHPDIVVFTGDIVNRRAEELKPFMRELSKIKAPMGVYSIMGNHDYGDYYEWPSPDKREQNEQRLKNMQARMGWQMLNNSTKWLKVGNDSIALIGVENVGDPPFHTYGDLHQAYPNITDNNVKILLTHNPAHWVNDISDSSANIDLTLSGHTHAMQMELLGLSPAAWRYSTWGGKYTDDKDQILYVNIGAGEVGFPARIGATPEITLFTLSSK